MPGRSPVTVLRTLIISSLSTPKVSRALSRSVLAATSAAAFATSSFLASAAAAASCFALACTSLREFFSNPWRTVSYFENSVGFAKRGTVRKSAARARVRRFMSGENVVAPEKLSGATVVSPLCVDEGHDVIRQRVLRGTVEIHHVPAVVVVDRQAVGVD